MDDKVSVLNSLRIGKDPMIEPLGDSIYRTRLEQEKEQMSLVQANLQAA